METVNPVDSDGDGRMLLGECLQVLAEDENVGIAAMATNLVHGRPYLYQSCEALERVFNATIKPTVVFGNIHSAVSREEAAKLRSLGIPVLMGTATALAAMKHLGAWQQRRERPVESKPIATEALPERLPEIESKPGAALPTEQAFAILEAFGIPVAKSAFIDSKHAAQAAARALGFPVVLRLRQRTYGTRLSGAVSPWASPMLRRPAGPTTTSRVAAALGCRCRRRRPPGRGPPGHDLRAAVRANADYRSRRHPD